MKEKKKKEKESEKKQQNGTLKILVGAIIIGLAGLAINSLFFVKSPLDQVHITGLTFHYYDVDTGNSWTYSPPGGYDIKAGSKQVYTLPYTSNISCAIIFIDAYSLTPGFEFHIYDLPLTLEPGHQTSIKMSIVAPNYSYIGPLDLAFRLRYRCSE